MNRKKFKKLYKKHIFLALILIIILGVGLIFVSRSVFSKPSYIYTKVRLGQGLWWVNSSRPNIWYLNSINKGDIMVNFLQKPAAEIISKKYYQAYGSSQFDIYLTLKLNAVKNRNTGQYTFNRSILSVGTPIELSFPREYITGTVIALSLNPFEEKLTEKIVYLTKRYAYPWEYEAIKIGDSFFDGEEKMLVVLDKSMSETTNIASDSFGNSTPEMVENRSYITIKAMLKVKKEGNYWVFGEDQIVSIGRDLGIATDNLVLMNYVVSKIE